MWKIFLILLTLFIVIFLSEILKGKASEEKTSIRKRAVLMAIAKAIEITVIALIASSLLQQILGPPGVSILLKGK